MGLLWPQGRADPNDVIIGPKAQFLPERAAMIPSVCVIEAPDIDAVVHDGIPVRVQSKPAPMAALILADIDQQVAALDQPPVQQHLQLFRVAHQEHRVEDGDELRPRLTAGARESAVQHGVHVRADDDVDAARLDQFAQLVHGPALQAPAHVTAHQRIESGPVHLGQQRLASLQVRQVNPEALGVDPVDQRDDLLLGAPDLQGVDDEQQTRRARGSGSIGHALCQMAILRRAARSRTADRCGSAAPASDPK